MIDINYQDIRNEDIEKMRVLILEASYDRLSSIGINWVNGIKYFKPDYFTLKYDQLYESLGFRRFQNYLLDFISKNNIDVIILPDVNYNYLMQFDLDLLNSLRQKVFLTAFLPDVYIYFDFYYRYIAQAFDLVLVDSYYDKFRFKVYGIDGVFFPYSYNSENYVDLKLERDIDVSFVGAAHKSGRKEFIEFLLKKNIPVETYGILTKNGGVTHEEMIRIFNRTKINLNFASLDEYMVNSSDFRINNRYKQLKGRVGEVLLTKSFLLTEFDPGLERIFEIGKGKDIDVFADKEELLEKINFYLGHNGMREQMADNAYLKAKKLFDYKENSLFLLKLIGNKAKKKKKIIIKPYYDKIYLDFIAAIRFYWLIKFLLKRKFTPAFGELFMIIRKKSFNIARTFKILSFFSVKLKKIFIKLEAY